MYFLIDQHNNQITGYKSLGIAARHTLAKLGGTVPDGGDPVKTLFNHPGYGNEVQVLGLSAVFRFIAEQINHGQNTAASKLALKLSEAVDIFHKKR